MTNKRRFVTAHKARYAVSTLCRVLAISRGWFYGFLASQPARDQRQAGRDARDPELLPGIKTFFKAGRKCYGSKRIHQDPVADGETVSERRVARILKENKVSPRLNKRRKPVTTDSNHKMSPSPNLLEQAFHCLTPDTVWLADITCIDTDEGWLWLAGVKDMATREIVGWAMEDHMRAGLCCDALTMAPGRRGPVPGLIHHSDRGSRYAGGEYRKLIKKAGLTQSMSRKGECLDNAPTERCPLPRLKYCTHGSGTFGKPCISQRCMESGISPCRVILNVSDINSPKRVQRLHLCVDFPRYHRVTCRP